MQKWESKTYEIRLFADCESHAVSQMNGILTKLGHTPIGMGDVFPVKD